MPKSETPVRYLLCCCCIRLRNVVLSTPSTACTVPNNKYTDSAACDEPQSEIEQQIEVSSSGPIAKLETEPPLGTRPTPRWIPRDSELEFSRSLETFEGVDAS